MARWLGSGQARGTTVVRDFLAQAKTLAAQEPDKMRQFLASFDFDGFLVRFPTRCFCHHKFSSG